jgi:hypothetical protein
VCPEFQTIPLFDILRLILSLTKSLGVRQIASYFIFSLSTIFSYNVTRKRMKVISLSTSLPKSSMQEELMTIITFITYLSRIVSSSWVSNKEDPRFDLNARI